MLINDPLFSKEGVKFFAELCTGSGGRRSETRPGDRREKNFKKGKQCKFLWYWNVKKKKLERS